MGRHYKHLQYIHKAPKVDPWQCLPVLEHAELNYLSLMPIGWMPCFNHSNSREISHSLAGIYVHFLALLHKVSRPLTLLIHASELSLLVN